MLIAAIKEGLITYANATLLGKPAATEPENTSQLAIEPEKKLADRSIKEIWNSFANSCSKFSPIESTPKVAVTYGVTRELLVPVLLTPIILAAIYLHANDAVEPSEFCQTNSSPMAIPICLAELGIGKAMNIYSSISVYQVAAASLFGVLASKFITNTIHSENKISWSDIAKLEALRQAEKVVLGL